MAQQVQKGMIIKLRLPDPQLQKLLEISGNANLGLSKLFEYFIEDMTSDTSLESGVLTEWLCRRTGASPVCDPEEEDEKLVDFSDNQVEIMNLLDLIMDN